MIWTILGVLAYYYITYLCVGLIILETKHNFYWGVTYEDLLICLILGCIPGFNILFASWCAMRLLMPYVFNIDWNDRVL